MNSLLIVCEKCKFLTRAGVMVLAIFAIHVQIHLKMIRIMMVFAKAVWIIYPGLRIIVQECLIRTREIPAELTETATAMMRIIAPWYIILAKPTPTAFLVRPMPA